MLSLGQHTNNIQVAGPENRTLGHPVMARLESPALAENRMHDRKEYPARYKIQKHRSFMLASFFLKESFWGSWLVFR